MVGFSLFLQTKDKQMHSSVIYNPVFVKNKIRTQKTVMLVDKTLSTPAAK